MPVSHLEFVCDAFNLGNYFSAQNAGGTRNHNFIFSTSHGRWFARQRFAGYSAPSQMEFDHAALAFLHQNGAAVAEPRQTIIGETWWENGNEIWEVFPFIEGRALRDGNSEDVIALGAALARFHAAGKLFPLRYEKISPRGETAPAFLRKRLIRIEKESPETAAILKIYQKSIEENAALLTDEIYNALPHTLIHGDVQPANLLLHKSTFVAFVDLDWCAWRARIYDLSFAILACCAHHKSTFDGGDIWSLTQTPYFENGIVEEFLSAYQNHATALSAAEKTALRSQIQLTWCHIRLGGALKVQAEQRLEFLQRAPNLDDSTWISLNI
jgi:Ser/Thr protein kinase RdoA (MazF antagonist)